jgi:hypothetical protein
VISHALHSASACSPATISSYIQPSHCFWRQLYSSCCSSSLCGRSCEESARKAAASRLGPCPKDPRAEQCTVFRRPTAGRNAPNADPRILAMTPWPRDVSSSCRFGGSATLSWIRPLPLEHRSPSSFLAKPFPPPFCHHPFLALHQYDVGVRRRQRDTAPSAFRVSMTVGELAWDVSLASAAFVPARGSIVPREGARWESAGR